MAYDRITQLVAANAPQPGVTETGLDGVVLYRKTTPIKRTPAVMNATVNLVVQGTKFAYLHGTSYRHEAGTYICAPMPLPIEAQVKEASIDQPVLGMSISLDTRATTELLLDLTPHRPPAPPPTGGDPDLAPTLVTWGNALTDAFERLLELLDNPQALQALGSGRLRELLYAIMTGPAGPSLWRTLGQVHDLNRTLTYIADRLHEPISIDDLARQAGMSRAVFDRRFRAATTYAPLQFIKALRLNDAALRIAQGSDITNAAISVGYASPAQFSRDFKRQYGTPPKQWSRTPEAASVAS